MSRLIASLSLIALLPMVSGCATAIIGAAGATAAALIAAARFSRKPGTSVSRLSRTRRKNSSPLS